MPARVKSRGDDSGGQHHCAVVLDVANAYKGYIAVCKTSWALVEIPNSTDPMIRTPTKQPPPICRNSHSRHRYYSRDLEACSSGTM